MVQIFEQYMRIATLKIKVSENDEDIEIEGDAFDKKFSVPNFDSLKSISQE